MEAIIVIVGFLGAGKTTLLKRLTKEYFEKSWNPFIILNDYQNANMDSQQFLEFLGPDQVNALSGSCICCSGINEFGLFAIYFFIVGIKFLLNKSLNINFKLTISTLLITQFITGAGYFNGGFAIFLFLMIILNDAKQRI